MALQPDTAPVNRDLGPPASLIPAASAPTFTCENRSLLANTLCARLCHDLAGTLGALSGMLDMAASLNDRDALCLAQDCAKELTAKLRLLRAAWASDSEVTDIQSLVAGLPGAEKLTIDISGVSIDSPGEIGRLAACLLIVAAQALPRGGHVALQAEDAEITVQISGPRIAWPMILNGTPDPGSPHISDIRDVSAVMAILQARRAGLELRLDGPARLLAKAG